MDATKPRRRKPSMPQALRKEVVEHCRKLTSKYRAAFKADRELKAKVLTLTRAMLPPATEAPRPTRQSADDARTCVVSEVPPQVSAGETSS